MRAFSSERVLIHVCVRVRLQRVLAGEPESKGKEEEKGRQGRLEAAVLRRPHQSYNLQPSHASL